MKSYRIATVLLALCGLGFAYPDRVLRRLSLTGIPTSSCHSENGRFAYLLDAANPKLHVVDTLLWKEVRTVSLAGIPQALACDAENLYVSVDIDDRLYRFSLETPSRPSLEETYVLESDDERFSQLVLLAAGGRIALRSQKDRVYVFDPATDALTEGGAAIDPGASIADLAAVNDGRLLLLTRAGSLRAYSASGFALLFSTTLGTAASRFSRVATDRSGTQNVAWVTRSSTDGELWSAKPLASSFTVLGPVAAGAKASALALMEVLRPKSGTANRYAYVGREEDDAIALFDATIGPSDPVDTLNGVGPVAKYGFDASEDDGFLFFSDATNSDWTVLSDQPKVEFRSFPAEIDDDDEQSLKVRASRSGQISLVLLDGDEADPVAIASGRLLATKNVDANTDAAIGFSTDRFKEGQNLVAAFLASGDFIGRIGAFANKDTVPAAPKGFELAFGREKVFVSWSRSKEADLDHYLLEFGTGGAFDGVAGLSSPIEVSREDTRRTLAPIPNGTTVNVRMAAVDRTGHQSPFTRTRVETPEDTVGLLSLVDEPGGCSAQSAQAMFVCLLLSVWGVRPCGRRRRSS